LPGRLLWHDRTFLTLAAAMALGLFAQIGLLAHLFSLLVPPLGEQAAGILMGLATASAIAGRTLVGWLMPAGSDRRLIACASLVAQIAGSIILMLAGGSEVVLLIMGVLLFGAGIGNTTSLPPLIAQVEFTRADVQRVVPLIVAIGQGTYAFAPAAFGALRTLSPVAATEVFAAAAGLSLTSINASSDINSGNSYTLLSVAAVVMGGCALTGGIIAPNGVVIGAVTLALIGALLGALGVSSDFNAAAQGAVLIALLAMRYLARNEAE